MTNRKTCGSPILSLCVIMFMRKTPTSVQPSHPTFCIRALINQNINRPTDLETIHTRTDKTPGIRALEVHTRTPFWNAQKITTQTGAYALPQGEPRLQDDDSEEANADMLWWRCMNNSG